MEVVIDLISWFVKIDFKVNNLILSRVLSVLD